MIPQSKVLITTHYGTYESLTLAYEVLEEYVTSHGLKTQLMIEEYLPDPPLEQYPCKWKTRVHFVVK